MLYCELNEVDPKAILRVSRTERFGDSSMNFTRIMGGAGLYITGFEKVLKS